MTHTLAEYREENKRLRLLNAAMLEALKWAQTYVLGHLPDSNTMTEQEIVDYTEALIDKINGAIALATGQST